MTNRKKTVATGSVAALGLFLLGACGGSSSDPTFTIVTLPDDPEGRSYTLGEPLHGLSSADLVAFNDGLNTFAETEDKEDGLGPVFNGESCGQCHIRGALGGAGTDLQLTRETRIGGMRNGKYSDLEDVGGPVIQARSLKEFDASYRFPGEVVPPGTQFVSRRITTPTFGDGLIEAIPDDAILARTHMKLPDGVAGVANMEMDPITNRLLVGRFGWKSQHATLDVFAADAYLNEMGITTPLFPTENPPQGHPLQPGDDVVADPEDTEDVAKFAAFMRFLAPPARSPLTQKGKQGEILFSKFGCANCHVPSMTTGPNANPALDHKPANLYSDLLVHHMGGQLADGVVQGQAKGDMFRTAPLWGLSKRLFFLHDGRANTFDAAITGHGGEGEAAKQRYLRAKPQERDQLIEFLGSL